MKIGLDIDGVILDFERTMRCYAELYDLFILKKDGVKNSEEFDYLKKYDWTLEEKNAFIDEYLIYATLNNTSLLPLAKEMIEFFKIEGYNYYFITARGLLNKKTKSAVINVFQKYGLPIDNIYFEVKDKVIKCKEIEIDLMIEDNPDICKKLIDNKINTLYFRDKDSKKIEDNDYLCEVSNIGEILRYIVKKYGYNNSTETYKRILKKL